MDYYKKYKKYKNKYFELKGRGRCITYDELDNINNKTQYIDKEYYIGTKKGEGYNSYMSYTLIKLPIKLYDININVIHHDSDFYKTLFAIYNNMLIPQSNNIHNIHKIYPIMISKYKKDITIYIKKEDKYKKSDESDEFIYTERYEEQKNKITEYKSKFLFLDCIDTNEIKLENKIIDLREIYNLKLITYTEYFISSDIQYFVNCIKHNTKYSNTITKISKILIAFNNIIEKLDKLNDLRNYNDGTTQINELINILAKYRETINTIIAQYTPKYTNSEVLNKIFDDLQLYFDQIDINKLIENNKCNKFNKSSEYFCKNINALKCTILIVVNKYIERCKSMNLNMFNKADYSFLDDINIENSKDSYNLLLQRPAIYHVNTVDINNIINKEEIQNIKFFNTITSVPDKMQSITDELQIILKGKIIEENINIDEYISNVLVFLNRILQLDNNLYTIYESNKTYNDIINYIKKIYIKCVSILIELFSSKKINIDDQPYLITLNELKQFFITEINDLLQYLKPKNQLRVNTKKKTCNNVLDLYEYIIERNEKQYITSKAYELEQIETMSEIRQRIYNGTIVKQE